MFPSGGGLSTSITGFIGSVKARLVFGLKYFYNWLGTKALISLYHWSHDGGLERMTTFVLTFAIVLYAMLADLKAAEERGIGPM